MARFDPDAYGNPAPRKQTNKAPVGRSAQVTKEENAKARSELQKNAGGLDDSRFAPKSTSSKRKGARQVVALHESFLATKLPTIFEDSSSEHDIDAVTVEPRPSTELSLPEQHFSSTDEPTHHQEVHDKSKLNYGDSQQTGAGVNIAVPSMGTHGDEVVHDRITDNTINTQHQKRLAQEHLPKNEHLTIEEKIARVRTEKLRSIALRIKARDQNATTSLADLDLARKKSWQTTQPVPVGLVLNSPDVKSENHSKVSNESNNGVENIDDKSAINVVARNELPRVEGNRSSNQSYPSAPLQSANLWSMAFPQSVECSNRRQTSARPLRETTNTGVLTQRSGFHANPYIDQSGVKHPLASWDNTMRPPPLDWDDRPNFDYSSPSHQDGLHKWRLESSADELFTTIPVDRLRNIDEQPDGISMVPKSTTLSGENAQHYGYSTNDTEDILQQAHPSDYADYEDWGKLDMSQPQNVAFKDETTEALVSHWLDQTRERRARVEAEKQRFVEAVRAFEDYEPAPNPHAPKLNIYLRPAGKADVPQITQIYNWYIKNSPRTAELYEISVDEMEDRLADVWSSKLPFIVAIERHKNTMVLDEVNPERENSPHELKNMNFRRRPVIGKEKIVGFACAQDLTASDYVERIAAELEIYVDPAHRQLGVGKCLMDQLVEASDRFHLKRGGYSFGCPVESRHLYSNGGGRDLHKIFFILRKWSSPTEPTVPEVNYKYRKAHSIKRLDDREDDYDKWIKEYLEGWNFEVAGILTEVGAKNGRFIDEVFLSRTTGWRPTEGKVPDPLYRL